jgi:hypothetical protein
MNRALADINLLTMYEIGRFIRSVYQLQKTLIQGISHPGSELSELISNTAIFWIALDCWKIPKSLLVALYVITAWKFSLAALLCYT